MARPGSLGGSVRGLRRVIARFAPNLNRHRKLIGLSLLALVAEVALRLLEPWPLKLVFDHVIARVSPGTFRAAVVDDRGPFEWLAWAAALVVALAVLRAAAAYGATVGFALVGNRVLTDARADLYAHLQRLSIAFHSRSRSGDLVIRVIGDIGLLKDVVVTALLPLMGNLLVLAGMLAVMLWLEWRLALVALTIVPLFAVLTLKRSRRIHHVARQQRRREGTLAAKTAESITAIRTVQALSLEAIFRDLFATQNAGSLTDGVKAKRLEAHLERSVDVLIAIATAVVLWYGTWLVLRLRITPGDLIVFLAYLKTAFRPLRDFAKYSGRLAKAAAAGERIVDVLDRRPDVVDRPGAVAAPRLRGHILLEQVTFAYDAAHPVLEGIDLEIRAGERVAIVGPSGSGKSTLAGLVLRLSDPTLGRVTIDGRDARDYTLDSLRRQFGVVLQDTLLFDASIRDNIAYGAAHASDADVRAAASLAGAAGFIETLPAGYDTRVGERGATLSAGQRQRIAIARAAVRDAAVVIFDEPTVGLDEENERAVLVALERLGTGRTSILVTHDLQTVVTADQIVYLEGGRILEHGRHETLLARGGRYARMFRLQAGDSAVPEVGTYAGRR